jgi:hypothetical protein
MPVQKAPGIDCETPYFIKEGKTSHSFSTDMISLRVIRFLKRNINVFNIY